MYSQKWRVGKRFLPDAKIEHREKNQPEVSPLQTYGYRSVPDTLRLPGFVRF